MREKTSKQSVIRIDYSGESVKTKLLPSAGVNLSALNPQSNHKFHLTGYEDRIMSSPKLKKLDPNSYRIIKQNKSKLLKTELEKSKVKAWKP